jgi:hypothetical protein
LSIEEAADRPTNLRVSVFMNDEGNDRRGPGAKAPDHDVADGPLRVGEHPCGIERAAQLVGKTIAVWRVDRTFGDGDEAAGTFAVTSKTQVARVVDQNKMHLAAKTPRRPTRLCRKARENAVFFHPAFETVDEHLSL